MVSPTPTQTNFIIKRLLLLLKATLCTPVYILNIAAIFFGLGGLITLILLNSGDFFIKIFEFFARTFNIQDGDYHHSYDPTNFLWLIYFCITIIIYFTDEWLNKKIGVKFFTNPKKQLIIIPIFTTLAYMPMFLLFSEKYDLISWEISIVIGLIIVTIIANYYNLLLNFIVLKIEKILAI